MSVISFTDVSYFRYSGNQIWIWVLGDSEDVIEVRKDGLHTHVVWAAS